MNLRGPWIEHLMQDEGLSYPDASRQLEGWELIPYVDPETDEHMATLIKMNAEVHFAIYRQFRHQGNVNARRLRQFLLPILESEGFLTTKLTDKDDDRFIKKLGFDQIGRSASGQRIYMMNEIRVLK